MGRPPKVLSDPAQGGKGNQNDVGGESAYVVAQGRTVVVSGETLFPGDAVNLADDEIQYLESLGFVTLEHDDDSLSGGVSNGIVSIRGGQESIVTRVP